MQIRNHWYRDAQGNRFYVMVRGDLGIKYMATAIELEVGRDRVAWMLRLARRRLAEAVRLGSRPT